MTKHYKAFIVVLICICAIDCNFVVDKSSNSESQLGGAFAHKILTPKGKNIVWDSLAKSSANGIWQNPNLFREPEKSIFHILDSKLNLDKAFEIPVVLEKILIDSSKLIVNTPGKGSFELAEKYTIQDTISEKKGIRNIARLPLVLKKREFAAKEALAPNYSNNTHFNIKYLTEANGMESSTVLSMLEDSRGMLWFGTMQGLSCYDGKSFTNYTTKDGLINGVINSIIEDKKGNIWFGTSGGLTCYNGDSFTHYTEAQGLGSNEVTTICEDKEGIIWIGTKNGASSFDGLSFMHYTKKQGLIDNEINAILADTKGNIWLGTSNGVSCYNGTDFINYKLYDNQDNSVSSMYEDNKGQIWFGTWEGGLSCYNGEYIIHYKNDWGLNDITVLSIIEDKDENIWFGTFGEGAICFDGTKFKRFTSEQGLVHNSVNSIIEDAIGQIWFGTVGGVSCYRKKSFVHYTKNQGLQQEQFYSIAQGVDSSLWFGGTDSVIQYRNQKFNSYVLPKGCGNVSAILNDSRGHLWFGTEKGVQCFNGAYLTTYTTQQGLANDWVSSIIEAKDGKIWIGTWGGVSCYDGSSFTNYSQKNGLASNSVSSILQDRNGDIWFGTMGGGISHFDGKYFTTINEDNGLANNKITSIAQDKNGVLWFGTYGDGLSCYDGVSLLNFNEKYGLGNNFIESLIVDSVNNLWIATQNGISFILLSDKQKFTDEVREKSYYIYNYNEQDGLISKNYSLNAVCIDKQNRIWWAGQKCLVMQDLNSSFLSDYKPLALLNTVEIHQQFIDYRELNKGTFNDENTSVKLPSIFHQKITFSDVAKYANYPLELKLPYNLNQLTFRFSATDWIAPGKLQYQYKLEGIDEYWSQPNAENSADYKNIPPGEYIFKLRAIGAAKKWSDTVEYSFEIYPPWWKAWWAKVFYGIGFILLVGGYIRLRIANLKKSKKVLEQKIKERTAEIEEQKEELLERNEEIMTQRDLLSKQNIAIGESIEYARHIQTAVMPSMEYIDELLPDNFILFRPRDVVSGDFYWVRQIKQFIVIVVADCTGHGVPGAFMSMLGISFINEVVRKREITKANHALNELREHVKQALEQTGKVGEADDGMDLAFCVLDTNTNLLQYSGANNSLYYIHDEQFKEIKADKMPVGYYLGETPSFTNHEIQLDKGDIIYLFSDGFMDQFGGKMGLKYKASNFQQLLIENHKKPLTIQHALLEDELTNWMNGHEQTDDILVMGVRV